MATYEVWLSVLRDVFIIIGLLLSFWRIYVMRDTFFSDHDRSRRTKAVDLIQFWSGKLTKKSSLARKLVESFSEEQCKSLVAEKSFDVDTTNISVLNQYFDVTTFNPTNRTLTEGQSSVLRWEIINYLNNLEAVFVAWRHNVADKEIIEEEFSYLYNAKENHSAVERFRTAAGTDSFMGVDEFIKKLKAKYEEKRKEKKGKGLLGFRKFRMLCLV